MGQLLCIASALCFGAMAILGRFAAASGVDTSTLLLLRFTIAGAVLWILFALRRERLPAGRDLAVLVGMGAIGYAGQAFAYFSALEHASTGLVALLLYLHPVIVALLARVVLRHTLRPVQLAAIALAVVGSALTVGEAGGSAPGVLFGLAAATIYAVYILTGSRLSSAATPIASTTVVVSAAAGVFAARAAVAGVHLPSTAAGWVAVLAIALVCTVAAVALFLAGLERLGPVRATIYSTVEPAFTILLAWVVLGERMTLLRACGGALILGGVILLARTDLRRREEAGPRRRRRVSRRGEHDQKAPEPAPKP